MKNLKFIIAYNGMNYNGYQRQLKKVTIQGTIETALSDILKQNIIINGCSRTDSGVHAKEFCFNVFIDDEVSSIPVFNIVKASNNLLPSDIIVLSCEETALKFHARYDAREKEYLYRINNGERRNPFMSGMELFYPFVLDESALNKTAQLFVGEHNFGAFCKAEAKRYLKSTVREISAFRVERKDDIVEFYVKGSGFLHNMVRILVGTLIYTAEGKLGEVDILKALETGERQIAGKTVPPFGLYLNRVIYD